MATTRSIGITVHRSNIKAWEQAAEIIEWLNSRNIQAVLDHATAQRLGRMDLIPKTRNWQDVEFVISLGGDGTILTSARTAAADGIPILGVHMGRFGFIAEYNPTDLISHIEEALNGCVHIEERMMLHVTILRGDLSISESIGLNDVTIKSSTSSLLNLNVSVAGDSFATYHADGVIVATSTGSTGYSLSAGGPIVEPTLQALIITPICPHTLSARAMVIPCHHTVEIELEEEGDEVIAKVDGQDAIQLHIGDRVVVKRSEFVTRLLLPEGSSYYRKVRARYLFGVRSDQH